MSAASDHRRPPPAGLALAAGLAAGVLVALSVPPFGFWPLGLVGTAVFAALLWDRPWPERARIGFAVGVGEFGIGIWFITGFQWFGYVGLLALGAGYLALAGALTPGRRWPLTGLPLALVVATRGREIFPFGGFPMGDAALGQAGGPLAPVVRLGGGLLLTGVIGLAGTSLALLTRSLISSRRPMPWAATRRPMPWTALAALAVAAALIVAGRVGPDGSGGTGAAPALRIATVQGGGIRGLRAVNADAEAVFQRHLRTSATVPTPVDVVLWPEDVLSVTAPATATPEAAQVAALARSLQATVIVGVVEDVGTDRFRNAAVAWDPNGDVVARYDKVHRVPFGEYVPGRSLIQHIANLSIIPRDAIPGHGPGLLRTPSGPLGVLISYEVFFPARARAAVRAGAQVILVPTNASSYRTGQVPSQEVAAARLRAWETGRYVVQAAPTGYSAIIDPSGRVLARSRLGASQVLSAVVHPRNGRTPFVRWGDRWLVYAALAGLVIAWRERLRTLAGPRRRAPLSPSA